MFAVPLFLVCAYLYLCISECLERCVCVCVCVCEMCVGGMEVSCMGVFVCNHVCECVCMCVRVCLYVRA